MAAKRGFRVRSSTTHARSVGPGSRRGRVAIAATAATAACLLAASPALADTGGAYFDANNNAAAGDPAHLFNATFSGSSNVGLGRSVMPNLTSGGNNTALGDVALNDNTTGNNNTAIGRAALFTNTTGTNNVATGHSALTLNTTGNFNVATGDGALISNTTGGDNVATGLSALFANKTGARNLGTGTNALFANGTGNDNIATGVNALLNSTGNSNIALGTEAGQNLTTGSDNIDIANEGKAGESKVMRIGTKGDQNRTFISGISGRTVKGTGQPVVVNNKGQLGTASAAKPAASKTVTDRRFARMEAEIKRQQRQIGRLQREVRKHG